MKILNGYISDNLELLSKDDLECSLKDLYRDHDMKEHVRLRLMCDYMEELGCRLHNEILYTPELVGRLRTADELLKSSTELAIKKAYKVYEVLKAGMNGDKEVFNDFYVTPILKVPSLWNDDKVDCIDGDPIDHDLWDACAEFANSGYSGSIIPDGRFYSREEYTRPIEDIVLDSVWGYDWEKGISTWAHDCWMPEEIVRGDYLFCWPFHNIVSHKYFPLEWLTRIKEYDVEIKVEMSNE